MPLRHGFRRRAQSPAVALPLLAVLAAALAACGGAETVNRTLPSFEEEIAIFVAEEVDEEIVRDRLLVGYLDLNDDGGDEAFALYLEEENCTGSACGGWIFQRAPAAGGEDRPPLTVLGRYASFSLPVASGQRRTNGWKDVIVRDPVSGRDTRLRFDGRVYR